MRPTIRDWLACLAIGCLLSIAAQSLAGGLPRVDPVQRGFDADRPAA